MSATPAPHLLHVFSTFVPAGPEMRTVGLINALGDEYRHSIIAMDGRTAAAEFLAADAPVKLLESPPKAGSVKTVLRMRRLLKREGPDAILTYNWGAFDTVIAARSLGLRNLVHHEDGFTPDEVTSFKSRRVKARSFFLPKVARIVVPSANLRRIALRHWKVSSDLVVHIPNGIDLSGFSERDGAPELRARLEIPADAPVAGGVGHLRPEKNFARLIRASREAIETSGMHLVILGDGQEREALEALAKEEPYAGHVHLVGHQGEPAAWYRMCDIFCITSDTEQMPVALLEAMATCLPVVSTDVGDIRLMLPGEQAQLLVALEDDQERVERGLSAAIRGLLAEPDRARALGRENRERVEERYSFESMLALYREAYRIALALR